MNRLLLLGALLVTTGARTTNPDAALEAEVNAVYAQSEALYLDLHQHPELSLHETQTAAKLAAELKTIGFEVTTGVGGTGIVGVLKNGAGPTVMLRTELDALPVTEATGLSYASKVKTKDAAGNEVGVMHACGHDAHMAAWIGTARIMANSKARWHGTLILIGQPAEEVVAGAKAMLDDGLFTRFPKPDYVLAVHDDGGHVAGEVGFHAGPILTNSDMVTITIHGRGGHGARPEMTIDPIVIAARTVVALQTIVSREISPLDQAVITVGSIHGGTKANIIPDDVELKLTVRSFTDPVREHLVSAIERVTKGEAAAAGATKVPTIVWSERTYALVNDSALVKRVSAALIRDLGPARAKDRGPEMASEDFALYQRAGVPVMMMRVGAVEPAKYAAAMKAGTPLPSLHSSQFAPDRAPTIKTAIASEVTALRELMGAK